MTTPGDERAPDPPSQPEQSSRPPAEQDAEAIPEELVEIVGDAAKAREVLRITASYTEWHGPLPPPSVLAAYNDAYDGAARDIVRMALDQSDHRRDLESSTIKSDLRVRQIGQVFGFIIAMTVIIGGFILVGTGRPVTGIISILVAVTGLVGLFIYSRKTAGEELEEKRAALEGRVPGSGPEEG